MTVPPAILLVEDDHFVAELYSHAFGSYGLRVTRVENAKDALRLATERPPKLLITDVNMLGMNGFEMAEELIRQGNKCFPLFFFTGQDDLTVLSRGLEAGGDAFLIKGANLLQIVERVLFWIETGFPGLPMAARTKALELATFAKDGPSKPIATTANLDADLLKSITAQILAEVEAAHKDYGSQPAERIYFLGRASHLVLEACTDLKSILRFPDYLISAIKEMNFPWMSDLNALLPNYDRLEQDPCFGSGAERGLISFVDEEVE